MCGHLNLKLLPIDFDSLVVPLATWSVLELGNLSSNRLETWSVRVVGQHWLFDSPVLPALLVGKY